MVMVMVVMVASVTEVCTALVAKILYTLRWLLRQLMFCPHLEL